MCKHLYEGEVIEVDLTNELTQIGCNHNKDHAVSNVTEFTRSAMYVRSENDKLFIR